MDLRFVRSVDILADGYFLKYLTDQILLGSYKIRIVKIKVDISIKHLNFY